MDLLFPFAGQLPRRRLPKEADARQDWWRDLNSGAPASESMSAVIVKRDSIVRVLSTSADADADADAASKGNDLFAVIIPLTTPTANHR